MTELKLYTDLRKQYKYMVWSQRKHFKPTLARRIRNVYAQLESLAYK